MDYDGPGLGPGEMVVRSPESTADTGELMDAERSGVSLNSSYLTISTANSSMSQGKVSFRFVKNCNVC